MDLLVIVSSAKAIGRSEINACVLQDLLHTSTTGFPANVVACENFIDDLVNGLADLGFLIGGPVADELTYVRSLRSIAKDYSDYRVSRLALCFFRKREREREDF